MKNRIAQGQRMTARREDLGLTQRQIAARAGVSPPYWGDIEAGRRGLGPRAATDKIAMAAGVPPNQLVIEYGHLPKDATITPEIAAAVNRLLEVMGAYEKGDITE